MRVSPRPALRNRLTPGLNLSRLTCSRNRAETEAVAEPAGLAEDGEDPINENRAGHLPTFHTTEHAIETPERPPTLIGRYSAGGANYMIFEDGSIEAETADGAFKFASMGDFKRYLADRRVGDAEHT